MRSLELGRRPSLDVAQSKCYTWRSAHAGMAMDNDSRCIGPRIDEFSDGPHVILAEENIRRLALLDDVCKMQSEHCSETAGELCRLRVRIRDGDADFPLAWLVTLGVLPREHDKRRHLFLSLSLGHRSTTLPPLRHDGQVAHDYVS